ncbi:Bestrophin, RFP-TM, chloride channel-domain-containing protein [Mariannaea sp. PMI_226]|nr:Bestrophin, RFP-TM, chloride channel-domain-containing protein [Mariannaea sp. PMI_226]
MADARSAGSNSTAIETLVTRPTMDGTDNASPKQPNEKQDPKRLVTLDIPNLTQSQSIPSPTVEIDRSMFRRTNTVDMEDYFTGPRDIAKHSKWPLIMQMHGSIIPKLLLPVLMVGAWATLITALHQKVHHIAVDSVLLTILGFVVGLSLSFRSSTAYERYAEGRRQWGALTLATQALGRVFWLHTKKDPNPDRDSREVIIEKLSAMNLLSAFALALKHKLRFEPYSNYPDIEHLIGHLHTFAKNAVDSKPDVPLSRRKNFFKEVGEYLGVSFATSNPRKVLKRSDQPLGNLPLEILSYIAVVLDKFVANQQLNVPMHLTLAYNNLNIMNDVMVGCDRVLNTPLPIAYTIAISQITFVYVILLPFQLVGKLEWLAIPATIAAAYIIFGLLFVGQEIENPFGFDVNDLPLDTFCDQIAHDLDIIASFDKLDANSFLYSKKNMPLYPVSSVPVSEWMKRSDEALAKAIKDKPKTMFSWRKQAIQKQEAAEAAKRHVSPLPVQEDDESQDYIPQPSHPVKFTHGTPGDHNV